MHNKTIFRQEWELYLKRELDFTVTTAAVQLPLQQQPAVSEQDRQLSIHERLARIQKPQYKSVLIVGFKGEYKFGSEGRPAALFMHTITAAAIGLVKTNGLLFDFSALHYEHGDNLSVVIRFPKERLGDDFPVGVVYSPACAPGIKGLFEFANLHDNFFLYDSLDTGINEILNTLPDSV
ncbi:MAG: hypothetical protein OEZ39_01015 [Gammaproteobacteria bacterium]|nr:hypothetical protein [Gammaproteobacteria bacterium]MDH5650431.1 hypothetical protein [Gammaproteobacteria bacterium]